LLSVVLGASLLILLHGEWFDAPPMWLQLVLDAGHAPLFGVLALIVLGLLRLAPRFERAGIGVYIAALSISVGLGLLSELLQYFGERNADGVDALRDAIGAVTFLGFHATFDPLLKPHLPCGPFTSRRLRATFLLLFLTTFWQVGSLGLGYVQRDAAHPRLFDFQHRWERHFYRLVRGDLEATTLPGEPSVAVARLTIRPGRYPGLRLRPHPDWSAYRELKLSVYSDLPGETVLRMRIDDRIHDGTLGDRYNTRFTLLPGWNRLSVDLDEVRRAPKERTMDLSQIRRVALFDVETEQEYSLYLGPIELSGAR